MGTMSNLIEFQPFSMIPPTYYNPQTQQGFRQANTYAEPKHLTFYPPFGPFTAAGVSEITRTEFLAGYNPMPRANAEIVSVPERPVDQGTYQAITQNKMQYNQPNRGVYLQPRTATVVNTTSVAGQAPNTGVYTGYGEDESLITNGVSR